jgi:hypothetical protein
MNIKNRVNKIESDLGFNSEYCHCSIAKHSEMYVTDLTSQSTDHSKKLVGNTAPDNCEKCGKRIEKEILSFILCDNEH